MNEPVTRGDVLLLVGVLLPVLGLAWIIHSAYEQGHFDAQLDATNAEYTQSLKDLSESQTNIGAVLQSWNPETNDTFTSKTKP